MANILEVQNVEWNIDGFKGWSKSEFKDWLKSCIKRGAFRKNLDASRIWDTIQKELEDQKKVNDKIKADKAKEAEKARESRLKAEKKATKKK
jgi:hypothetical protein